MMSGTSSWPRIFLLFILSCALVISSTSAIDAPNYDYSLGITPSQYGRDQGFTQQGKNILYATVLEYDRDTATFLTPDQLIGIAAHAWDEMAALHQANHARCGQGDDDKYPPLPAAISALAVGNRVYISSSFQWKAARKDLVYVILQDSQLTRLLNACQSELQVSNPEAAVNVRHRDQATCAEIFTVQQYLNHNNNQSPKEWTASEKRIATWGTNGFKGGRASGMYACNGGGDVQRWGCEAFMDSLGINPMNDLIVTYGKDSTKIPPRTPEKPRILDAGLSIQLQGAVNAPMAVGS